MKLSIQRRTVVLDPPHGMDVIWVTRQMQNPEIETNFAWGDDLTAADVCAGHRLGRVVIGIMHRAQDGARIGFAMVLPPHEGKDFWELLAAIPQRRHRDAFSMVHTVDAMSHYMFDHVGVALCGTTIRPDNQATLAVVKRMGYVQRDVKPDANGVPHVVFVLTREQWTARRARLERGEQAHPSGGVFVVKR